MNGCMIALVTIISIIVLCGIVGIIIVMMNTGSTYSKIKTGLETVQFVRDHAKKCCRYKKGDEEFNMCTDVYCDCPIPGEGIELVKSSWKFGTGKTPPCKRCLGINVEEKRFYPDKDIQWLYDTFGQERFDHAVEWLESIATNKDYKDELELVIKKYGKEMVDAALGWLQEKSKEADLGNGIKWLLKKVKE